MPRGYPDFFGTQSFPKLGTMVVGANSIMVANDGLWHDITDISGKVIMRRCGFSCNGDFVLNTMSFRVQLDSGYADEVRLDYLEAQTNLENKWHGWQLYRMDQVLQTYDFGYYIELTSLARFQMAAKNTGAAAIGVGTTYEYYIQQ